MIPPPCVVASHIHIQRIVAIGLQKLRCLKSLLQVAALFLKVLARKRALSPVLDHALRTEAHCHREIPAAGPRDFLADFFRKAKPVLQASAVFVSSVIKEGNSELVDKIALMDRVNLHTVEACSFRIKRTFSKAFYNLMNLILRKLPTGLVKPAMGNGRGSYRRKLSQICRNCHTSKSA